MHHIYIYVYASRWHFNVSARFTSSLLIPHFFTPFASIFLSLSLSLSFALSLSLFQIRFLSLTYSLVLFFFFFFFCLYIYCYWIHCIVVVSPIRTDITHLLLHFFFFSPYLLLLFSPSFLASSFLLAPFIVPLWFERNCWREDVERFSIFRFRGSFLLFFFFVSTLLTVITEKEQYFWKGTAPKKKKKKNGGEEAPKERNLQNSSLLFYILFFFHFNFYPYPLLGDRTISLRTSWNLFVEYSVSFHYPRNDKRLRK